VSPITGERPTTKEHEKHIQQTLGTIKKLVDDNLLPSIKGATTVKAALNILEAQLVAKNTARFIATICKLFLLKKKPEQSVAAYFAELDGLITLTVADAAEGHQALRSPPGSQHACGWTAVAVHDCVLK